MLNETNKEARLGPSTFFIVNLIDRKLQVYYAAMMGVMVMQSAAALYQLY